MFEIKFTEEAAEDLEVFSELEQKQVVRAIEAQLTFDAANEDGFRKRLQPFGPAEWEMRIGNIRVFYDVEYDMSEVKIESIGKTFFGRNSTHDDFGEEIEITRATTALITLLKERAGFPAALSLQEVKKRFGLYSMNLPS